MVNLIFSMLSHGNNRATRIWTTCTQVLHSHEIRRCEHPGGSHGAEHDVLDALVFRVNGVNGVLTATPVRFAPRVDVFGLQLRMNASHVLHAVAREETLVRTIRTPEELPAFDAVRRMLT